MELVPRDQAEVAAVPPDTRAVRKTRRDELSAFLKSRRARITPGEVGLPTGSRRRTPGLRREEVAQLAGVGITWYTWLEQGRDIHVSIQVLEAISRTLCLDGAERAHLYRLADVPTIPAPQFDEPVPEEIQVILDHLTPLPAVLLSGKYDVLAYNSAYAALCPGFVLGERNILRKVFLAPECCNPYAAQHEYLARMVGYLRAAYVKNLHDPVWTVFIDDLVAASPLFAEMWARNDVAFPVGRIRVIRNVVTGDIEMTMTSLSLPSIAGAWVQILTPVDEDGWIRLRALLEMTQEQRRQPWVRHFEQFHPEAVGRVRIPADSTPG
ncbi:helix-turn-helix transcriptional regulator [Nocardia sp. NPDC052001]|uniref:helix-turn-helix transcriptional regulator n=1 Tax=Nocardia sp. NPDC052001 TaxID=3154853 RepID=UPI0034295255